MQRVKDPKIHTIIDNLKTRYNLKEQDFFSASICLVNFLEYYVEEGMCDMMYDCPESYCRCDSNNRKACAGALKGEQKSQKVTAEEQFAYYAVQVQGYVVEPIDGLEDLAKELEDRMKTCYRKEVFIPFVLGADVDSFTNVGDFISQVGEDEEYLPLLLDVFERI